MPIDPPSRFFPPAEAADEDGYIGSGGELSPEWLLDAYSHGIFPWPIWNEGEPMAWWSLDPRAIIELDGLHISRRLRRTMRSGKFDITYDRDFLAVIEGCAEVPDRRGQTWLTSQMIAAYTELHDEGHAHSAEAWHDGKLAGGVYGVTIGGLFAAESMFYRVRDASKVALAELVAHLRACGYVLLDIQQRTTHSASLGAVEIDRTDYLRRLTSAIDLPVTFSTPSTPSTPSTFSPPSNMA